MEFRPELESYVLSEVSRWFSGMVQVRMCDKQDFLGDMTQRHAFLTLYRHINGFPQTARKLSHAMVAMLFGSTMLGLSGCSSSTDTLGTTTASSPNRPQHSLVPRLPPPMNPERTALLQKQKDLYVWANDVLFQRLESDYAEAQSKLFDLLHEQEKIIGPSAPCIAITCDKLGKLLRRAGDHAEEEKLCRRALAIRSSCLGPMAPDTVSSVRHVADAMKSEGKVKEALQMLIEYSRLPKTGDSSLCSGETALAYEIGKNLNDLHQYEEAQPWLSQAARTKNERAHGSTGYPTELLAFTVLADNEVKTGKLDLAHNHFIQAAKNRFGKNEFDSAIVGGLIRLGDEYLKLHQSLESTNCYSEAFDIGRKSRSNKLSPDLVRVAYARMHLQNKPD